jgi:hypothetical protein
MPRNRVEREHQRVDLHMVFDDGLEVDDKGATLVIKTQFLDTSTLAGNSEIEGMKARRVTLTRPLEFDRMGVSATMTLSNGDGWRVFSPDSRTLVETQ